MIFITLLYIYVCVDLSAITPTESKLINVYQISDDRSIYIYMYIYNIKNHQKIPILLSESHGRRSASRPTCLTWRPWRRRWSGWTSREIRSKVVSRQDLCHGHFNWGFIGIYEGMWMAWISGILEIEEFHGIFGHHGHCNWGCVGMWMAQKHQSGGANPLRSPGKKNMV